MYTFMYIQILGLQTDTTILIICIEIHVCLFDYPYEIFYIGMLIRYQLLVPPTIFNTGTNTMWHTTLPG